MEQACFVEGSGKFLVDTGSQLNLIKQGRLILEIEINDKMVYSLTGIGTGIIRTYGEVVIPICNVEIKFQIVKDDFSITENGILGMTFLEQQEVTLKRKHLPNSLWLDNKELPFCATSATLNFPSRTKVLVTIPVKNKEKKQGYIRRLETGPGVYVGEALATQENGFVKTFAINTNVKDITLTTPSVELEEFQVRPPAPRSARAMDPDKGQTRADAQRLTQLHKILHLNSLSESELASILEIINEFPYQFYLPTDKLGSTNVAQHTITRYCR